MTPIIRLVLLCGLLVAALAGCEDEGGAERAGERLDEAVEDVRDSSAEMRDDAEDEMDDARREFDESVDEARDALED